MGSGGARARSGPQPDPKSGRSDRRGLSFAVLPASGFTGEVPDFPLPGESAREAEVWAELWSTPQAFAWSKQPWRLHEIGAFVRLSVRIEAPDASASLLTPWLRMQTALGLTPDGLKVNGWQIKDEAPAETPARDGIVVQMPERRMRG